MVDAALQQLFSNNGLTDAQVTYLAAKGITSVIKLGNMFDTREKVTEFVTGFDVPVSAQKRGCAGSRAVVYT